MTDFEDLVPPLPGSQSWNLVRSRAELEAARETVWARAQLALGRVVAEEWRGRGPFGLPGICPLEGVAVRFLVDVEWSGDEGDVLPNYRERTFCPSCGLNSRQRALAVVAVRRLARRPLAAPVLLLETATPLFAALDQRLLGAQLVGSEYLGPECRPGEVVDGTRHEDACGLSFAAEGLAAHLSSDVLEHVADPRLALREAYRCLRHEGVMLFTIPFRENVDRSCQRARIDDVGRRLHLAPPEMHGDPLRKEGSLVVTDFGWDVLEWMRELGFRDAAVLAYWDVCFGLLHPVDFLFVGVK